MKNKQEIFPENQFWDLCEMISALIELDKKILTQNLNDN